MALTHTHTHTHKTLSRRKSQSAMEYLMSYGWAILIIAVVLGVLFQLGVFSGGNLAPKAPPGACEVLRTAAVVSLEGECQGQLPQFVARFDGSTGYVSTGTTGLPTGSQAESVFAWIYMPTVSSPYPLVFNFGTASGQEMSGLQVRNGYVALTTDVSPYTGSSPLPVTAGVWQFIGYSIPAGTNPTITLYNDGQSTTSAITTLSVTQGSSYIGQFIGTGDYFPGQIADLQVYNTSLSSGEVSALYHEGIGGAPIRLQNLVGWWPLNGDVKDYSGNNNNGAISGQVTFNSTWNSQYTPP